MKLSYLLLAACLVGCFEAPERTSATSIEIPSVSQTKPKPLENSSFEHAPSLQIHEEIILPKDYKFSPEEELDLHGKRVNKAQGLITAFLDNAVKAGKEFALIITGKGLHSTEKFILDDGSEAGPIKYHFLLWLKNGIFSNYVQGISYTHRVHGGEGAFYIHLKKRTVTQS